MLLKARVLTEEQTAEASSRRNGGAYTEAPFAFEPAVTFERANLNQVRLTRVTS